MTVWGSEGRSRLNVRHATSSAFKGIKVGQVIKSRRYSSESHELSAAWAKRRPWGAFIRAFVAHGQKRSLSRDVPRHPNWKVFGRVDENL
jgi:hypothetical protein